MRKSWYLAAGVLLGGLIGWVTGIFTADRSGRETIRRISDKAHDLTDRVTAPLRRDTGSIYEANDAEEIVIPDQVLSQTRLDGDLVDSTLIGEQAERKDDIALGDDLKKAWKKTIDFVNDVADDAKDMLDDDNEPKCEADCAGDNAKGKTDDSAEAAGDTGGCVDDKVNDVDDAVDCPDNCAQEHCDDAGAQEEEKEVTDDDREIKS
ncbi:MAG: YtxH domain-containing protein [Chloroflexi bacterium]|nr:YtxH domain-containing protein [Chloroflexota bacterium]